MHRRQGQGLIPSREARIRWAGKELDKQTGEEGGWQAGEWDDDADADGGGGDGGGMTMLQGLRLAPPEIMPGEMPLGGPLVGTP